MEEKNREVIEQYDIVINQLRRVKGMLLLDTCEGQRIIRITHGSEQRYRFQDAVTRKLHELGFIEVDRIIRNREGNILTNNALGDTYIMKEYFDGEECNPNDISEVILGAENLARLHRVLAHVDISGENVGVYCQEELGGVLLRRLRELKRVKGYLREKKKKNQFEVLYCNVGERFYRQAETAWKEFRILSASDEERTGSAGRTGDYGTILDLSRGLLHGKYCHHNVLMLNGGSGVRKLATIGFECCSYGFQITDLYYYLRKIMEKNCWDIRMGRSILEAYGAVRRLSVHEHQLLYILLLFPEKFWKITNYYYNGKKTWIPGKNYHKLQAAAEQQEAKERFLATLKKG